MGDVITIEHNGQQFEVERGSAVHDRLAKEGVLAAAVSDASSDDRFASMNKAALQKEADERPELTVEGTGKNGAVTAEDLRTALRAAPVE